MSRENFNIKKIIFANTKIIPSLREYSIAYLTRTTRGSIKIYRTPLVGFNFYKFTTTHS